MKRVTNGFRYLGLPQFSQLLEIVVASMTGNTYFTSLQTAVEALSTEADSFYALVIKAATRDKNGILARDASRNKLIDMLHNRGLQVSAIAKSNEEILASSGLPYTQPKRSTPPMEKPAPPKVKSGVNSAEIDCRTTTQQGMKSANFYITDDVSALTEGSTSWSVTSSNSTKYTFADVTPGRRYYIKVGLVGVRGQEVVSDPVSFIAQ